MRATTCLRTFCLAAIACNTTKAQQPPTPTNDIPQVRIIMKGGSTIVGTPATASLRLRTDYAAFDLPFTRIRTAHFATNEGPTRVRLANGDKIMCAIVSTQVVVQADFGTAPLPVKLMSRIVVDFGLDHLSGLPLALHEGLLLYYPFSGRQTFATDTSGCGNHGVFSGAKRDSCPDRGAACRFSGNSYIRLRTNRGIVSGEGPFSISTWIKTKAKHLQGLVQQRDKAAFNGEFELKVNGHGTLHYYEFLNSFGMRFDSTVRVNDGKWHHIAFVRDADGGRFFIDAKPAGHRKKAPLSISSQLDLAIGCDYRDSTHYFAGMMDDVMIYNRALTTNDISQLHCLQKHATPLD